MRLLRHAAGDLGAQCLQLLPGFVAAHGRQAAGQHDGLAVQRSGGHRHVRRRDRPQFVEGRTAARQQLRVGLVLQPGGEGVGRIAGQTGGDEVVHRRIQQRLHRRECRGQLLGAHAGDLGNLQVDQHRGQLQAGAQLARRGMRIADHHPARQQVVDGLLVAGLVEEVAQRARHFAADVRHLLEQRPRQATDHLQVAEPLRQGLGGALTDVLDAETEQEALQRGPAAAVDGLDQVLGPLGRDLARFHRLGRGAIALVDAPLHLQQVVQRQLVQVGHVLHEAQVAEILDETFAQALDVHRPARGEVDDRLLALRRAGQLAAAAPHRLAFLADDLRAADRALGRHLPRHGAVRAPFGHHADDLRDHVAGAAHDHRVAVAHVQPCHLVGVVQGGTGDGHAAHVHRLHQRPRRHGAGAADIDLDRLQYRHLLLRGELVRDRPARRARDEAHLALPFPVVQLVDHAVDVERQPVACLADATVVVEQAFHAFHHLAEAADREAPAAQLLQRGRVRIRQFAALDQAGAVGEERQRPLRGDARVQLAQRTGGAIARVRQHLAAMLAGVLVVRLEIGARHVHLAAHFQHVRPAGAAQGQRDGLDGAQVEGDVLAGGAVAAGGALHEGAAFVTQADRQAVELGLGREPQRRALQPVGDAADEVVDLLVAESVAQREHGNGMAHFGELAGGRITHPLGGRIGGDQIRMRCLQRLQFAQQAVVLRIRDAGLVQDVVAVVGILQLAAEVGDACGRGRRRHR